MFVCMNVEPVRHKLQELGCCVKADEEPGEGGNEWYCLGTRHGMGCGWHNIHFSWM